MIELVDFSAAAIVQINLILEMDQEQSEDGGKWCSVMKKETLYKTVVYLFVMMIVETAMEMTLTVHIVTWKDSAVPMFVLLRGCWRNVGWFQ